MSEQEHIDPLGLSRSDDIDAATARSILDFALEASNIGLWKWNIAKGTVYLSQGLKDLLQITDENFNGALEFFEQRSHPDDLPNIMAAMQSHLTQNTPLTEEHRMRRGNGEYVSIRIQGRASRDENGTPVRVAGSVMDISPEVKLRRDLEASQKELRLIFDRVPARIWYKDAHNKILRLNAQAADSMNLAVEAAEGADTYDLYPDMAKKYHDDDLAVINSGEPLLGIVEEYTPLDGEHGWVKTDKIPYTDPDNDEKYVFVMSTDVTKMVETEKKILENEQRLNSIMESSLDGYWDIDFRTNTAVYSDRYWHMLGINPKEAANTPCAWDGLVVENDLALMHDNFEAHNRTKGKTAYSLELRCRHSDGSIVHILRRGNITEWDENDKPLRMIGTNTDITKLRETQKIAQNVNERFTVAANLSPVGFWDWVMANGETQESVWWSPVHYKILGFEPGAFPASFEAFHERVHPQDRDHLHDNLKAHFETKAAFLVEIRAINNDGHYRWLMVSGQAQWDEDNRPTRMLGYIIDIHESKKARASLDLYTRQLEQANKDLDHFAYVASHDLKAPLRGMDNITQWIEEDLGENLQPDIKEKLDLLRGRVHRMENLLKDILAFSRAGKDNIEIETFNVDELIDEVKEWLSPLGKFKMESIGTMPTVNLSRSLMGHIFLNLLSNARKHHDKDGGTIEIRCIDHGQQYEFIISDDGPGIPEQYQKHVFQIFKKLESRDKVEGSGIGLAIVKKMVESIGGKIWIVSEDNKRGTAFHFTIPQSIET